MAETAGVTFPDSSSYAKPIAEGFAVLLDIGIQRIPDLVRAFPAFLEGVDAADPTASLSMIADALHVDALSLDSAMRLISIWAHASSDSAIQLAPEDFVSSIWVRPEFQALDRQSDCTEAAIELLRAIQSNSEAISSAKANLHGRHGAIPAFSGITYSVELRGVFEFSDDEKKEPPPKVIGVIPIASICLDLDSGEPSQISFQATKDQVDHMIRILERIRDQSTELVKFAGK